MRPECNINFKQIWFDSIIRYEVPQAGDCSTLQFLNLDTGGQCYHRWLLRGMTGGYTLLHTLTVKHTHTLRASTYTVNNVYCMWDCNGAWQRVGLVLLSLVKLLPQKMKKSQNQRCLSILQYGMIICGCLEIHGIVSVMWISVLYVYGWLLWVDGVHVCMLNMRVHEQGCVEVGRRCILRFLSESLNVSMAPFLIVCVCVLWHLKQVPVP